MQLDFPIDYFVLHCILYNVYYVLDDIYLYKYNTMTT